ncbi:MAG: protein kinase [Pirellulaceae bacterium]|nr:protein kinase [Pirellulaceae bacterium]
MIVSRFKLNELLDVSQICSRYLGMLPDGREAEICLFRRTPQDEFERWMQRLRLASLIACPSCLHVLMVDEIHEPPFAATSKRGGVTLAEWTKQVSSEAGVKSTSGLVAEIEGLARGCVQALAACENISLVVGGFTPNNVFRSNAGQWQVDTTGLRSAMLGAVSFEADQSEFLPPEFARTSAKFDSPCDIAADVYSMAAVLRSAIAACKLDDHPVAQQLMSAMSDCFAEEPAARPTAHELLKRWAIPQRSLDVTSDSTSNPIDQEFDATINASTPEVPVGILVEGSQLGRYTVCEKLGVGGMGAVYRAVDGVDNKSVAIKILNKQVAPDSIAARRFAKEARLQAKANNPYVANLFEVNGDASQPYMVVEFIDGGTLGSLVKAGQPFDEQFALTVMADAVRGLAIAHARGIVHRDFKPDNVLLTNETRQWLSANAPYAVDGAQSKTPPSGKIYAKVSDFGLARTAQQSESMAMTRDGALLGTPLYMSPEQCRGEPAGMASDVYSVGITLFQLLSGRPPFEADTQVGLLNQHCNAAPPSLKQLRPQLSDAIVRTIENCLAKNPEARYATAGALLVDLENILRGEPTSLGLHPPILSMDDPDVMRFEHAWDFVSSPSQLWPYVSNTDRVNHAIGLPAVTYTTRQDPVQGVQRFAETKVAGQRIRWQEHPYEWIEGRRLSVLREFTHGPFRWFVNVVELQPTVGGGTRITQTLIVTPRNWLGKQLARLQLGKKSKANFGRAYQQIDDYISQSQFSQADRDPFIGRTELRPGQLQKLQTRLEQLRARNIDPLVIDTLGQFLEHASDLEVARIRPIALAERFKLNPSQVVNACLEGTRLGIFSLLWDIMCPSCRIPADIQETLSAIKDHGFCEACNLNFGIDLADSVELIFRVHPEIREVVTATYCIGGPAWSRHVVAQVRLAAGERFACELSLSEGAYVVRGPQLPFTINFRVGHNEGIRRIELSTARPPSDTRIQLPIGSQVIYLCNDSAVDQQVRIERTADRQDALSAAKASTLALFRELFPSEVLSSDQIVSVAHITVMRVKMHGSQQLYESLGDGPAFNQIRAALDRILRAVKENSGAVVKTIGEGVLASFADPKGAVSTAIELIQSGGSDGSQISVAIHSGSAMVATVDERLDYFGKTLKTLEQLIEAVAPQCIAVTSSILELAEIQSLLEDRQLKVRVLPELALSDNSIGHELN